MTTLNYEFFQDGQKQLHSVGCSLITNDIRKLSTSLPDDKIIIFGTCSYIGEAENYSKFLITFLHKCFPEYKIYAAGCDVNFDKEFYDKFDQTFTNDMLCNYEENNIFNTDESVSIKIQDGCNNNCSYCVINKLRKNPHSISAKNILYQIPENSFDVELYGTEICYYKDKNLDLLGLLNLILEKRNNIKTLSLSSLDPSSPIIFDLITFIKNHSQMIPHITLAVQSGSNKVLKDMNRHYNSDKLKEIHEFALKQNVSIGWEIIVGFPTETDELFEETRTLFNDLKPINNTIFKYSPRIGTPSYNLKQLDSDIISNRYSILQKDESEWLQIKLNENPLKNYFINVKHILPELTYQRLLDKYNQKKYINNIKITSEETLINYIRNQYFKKEAPKELHISYHKNVEFILKFLKEFLPETKVVLEIEKNIDKDDKEFLVEFGCEIRRI